MSYFISSYFIVILILLQAKTDVAFISHYLYKKIAEVDNKKCYNELVIFSEKKKYKYMYSDINHNNPYNVFINNAAIH